MKDLYFVYCNDSGFECFLTLDDAIDAADERIQGYLDDAWSDEVTSVCAGKITHRAKMCDQVFPDGEIDEDGIDESGELWDPDCEYKCNYKMLPVKKQSLAPEVAKLVWALKQILGWRELRRGREFPIERIEDIARAALTAYRNQGGDL